MWWIIPYKKWNQEVAIFPPKQSKTDEESITSNKLQIHEKLQPTY